jgi:hypothetical protein
MLVTRYFLYVGGALLSLLFAIGALVPQDAATTTHSAPGIDQSTVRIRSVEKLPERVVYDTSLPTIVPPAATPVAAVAPAAVAAPAQISAQARVRETFAQFVPAEPKKADVPAPRKRKVARVRTAPPPMMMFGQPPMRIAQQSRFGFFGAPVWRSTW